MVVGALMLKRWIVQNGASEMTGFALLSGKNLK
jgi:hypothetical protein